MDTYEIISFGVCRSSKTKLLGLGISKKGPVLISVAVYLLQETSKVQAVLISTETLCVLIGLNVMMMLAKYVSYN